MKIRTNPYTLRLKYVALLALFIDVTVTLLGHPTGYWSNPKLTNEGNQMFKYFALSGGSAFLGSLAVYATVVFLGLKYFPGRVALIACYAFILGHFFGASTWICYFFKFGVEGVVYYAIGLSTLIVVLSWERIAANKNEVASPFLSRIIRYLFSNA
jgi:hypothetical protein